VLVAALKKILKDAIKIGGTTLKDFSSPEGKPGYFVQKLFVYGRGNQACYLCKTPLKSSKIAQRTTIYCSTCQQ
jgi:formamidopyrimidine-DNA glycosylase